MIKKDDIVKLKSGGPKMTVREPENGLWVCTWFVGDKMKQGLFSTEQLQVEA
ncbi:DUF2158 domain-containing protein [Chryseobacterium wangxinyae]|uniref:DUF2158 domain-containing protein n=1 Tax=Chryseobacterium sp. CY350 TaxID=2997336 RepID=UPI0022720852|nr:DUF2158 domain-containing protein [Chryseobacterium sp. CY350]MCY0977223.1 DUF2158 domain-containing protein [Chryseobacterium sp. CY350]WBZ95757.1 DUF2158 domain-containing protein [Chryseobacterium sp. CY350]